VHPDPTRAAGSRRPKAGSGGGRPHREVSGQILVVRQAAATTTHGWVRRAMDGLGGLAPVYLINRGGQQNASENTIFTVTFDPRRLLKPPRLIIYFRLG